jgi:hypothetical protein
LAADFGGGAVHGKKVLIFSFAEAVLVDVEVAEFHADGVAPFNPDSGKFSGNRSIIGGRAKVRRR